MPKACDAPFASCSDISIKRKQFRQRSARAVSHLSQRSKRLAPTSTVITYAQADGSITLTGIDVDDLLQQHQTHLWLL